MSWGTAPCSLQQNRDQNLLTVMSPPHPLLPDVRCWRPQLTLSTGSTSFSGQERSGGQVWEPGGHG